MSIHADAIAIFKKHDAKDKGELAILLAAEKLYTKALQNAGSKFVASKATRKSTKLVDNEQEVQYSKGTKYLSYDKIGTKRIAEIRQKLNGIYNGYDNCVADGIAIEVGDIVYIVDSGKENGEIRFGIRYFVQIENDDLRKNFLRRTNNESISNGYISDGLSSRIGNEYAYNRFRNTGREIGEELSTAYRESEHNEGRVSQENGNRGIRSVSFSLSTSQEKALRERGITGDRLLDCIDLADEILSVNGKITEDGKVILYHATSNENAEKIRKSGMMYGKEDNLFFSTKKDGEINGYGEDVVEVKIPLEKLQLNDIFTDEVHLTMAVKPNKMTSIRFSVGTKYSKRDVSTVTEEEYYHHYWAVANNILTKVEIAQLNDYIGQIKRGEYFNKTSDGFYMIPVGENGFYNKIVFSDGKYESYSINKIITIDADKETDLTNARGIIYDRERNGIHKEDSQLFKTISSTDFRFSDFRREFKEIGKNSGRDRNGRGSGSETERITGDHPAEDGTTEITNNDGATETESPKFSIGGRDGYDGYSMSNNARSAYSNGEKPLSKWTKQSVVEEIADYLGVDTEDIKLLKPYKEYAEYSSWHPTSKYYNRTAF